MSLHVTQHGTVRRRRSLKLAPPPPKPCKRGHKAERYRGWCIECKRICQAKWREKRREYMREYARWWWKDRREKGIV